MATTGPSLQCSIHPLGALAPYKYVVICTRYDGQWLLSRHRERSTWETQGGHIEPGAHSLARSVSLYGVSRIHAFRLY